MDEFSVWCRAISPTFVPSTSQTLKLAACASASETSSSATGEPSLPTHYTHITHQHNTPSHIAYTKINHPPKLSAPSPGYLTHPNPSHPPHPSTLEKAQFSFI